MLILNALICIGGFVAIFLLVQRKVGAFSRSFETLENELHKKQEVLHGFSQAVLGYDSNDALKEAQEASQREETKLGEVKNVLVSTETEVGKVDIRLRELEELGRELAASDLDIAREVEMLKQQQSELKQEADAVRDRVNSSISAIDSLLIELADREIAVERLNAARADLAQTHGQIEYYESEIARVNEKYLELKRAYDALDIEYAQLYERQNAAG